MVRRPTGTIIAPPQPCRMRHDEHVDALEIPQRNDPIVKIPIAEANTGGAIAIRHPTADGNENRQAQV